MLAVLWLSAALSAIAFTLASTVRGEVDRASTALEGARSYYLATGAIERAMLYMEWGPAYMQPDGTSRFFAPWMPALRFTFPTGDAVVEVIPESSKLSLNGARPEDLYRLLMVLGVDPERAREIVLAILDWRSPAEGGPSLFDQFYLARTPSFRARHASFEEVEELLLLKGVTPDLFYGSFEPDADGRLVARPGLKDCVSVFGSGDQVDVNTAPPAVLSTVGLSPEAVAAIVEARRTSPFRSTEQLRALGVGSGPALERLRAGGSSIYTLRATARLRPQGGELSDLRRSVAAVIKLGGGQRPLVLRWYDNVWVQ